MKTTTLRVVISATALMFLLLFNLGTGFAQTPTGSILGTVHDSSGAVIGRASVSARNVETGAVRTVVTDNSGAYEIPSAAAGVYEVEAVSGGFRTEQRRATLEVAGIVTLNFTLTVGQAQEKVVVSGEPPQVETTNATVSGVVGETAIRELPLNGRDWLQLATLQAGVVGGLGQQSSAQSTNSRAARGNGENLYISGNRPTENVYLVDGLIVNDYANASPGSGLNVNLGVEAVREFAVLSSEYTAEYGLTSGGVVTAVFKSGTNRFHGTGFEFARNSVFDARNFFDQPGADTPPFHRNQFGGSVGGPIKKDKTFFFASYEGLRQLRSLSESSDTLSPNARNGILCANKACSSTTTVAIAPSIQPFLALFPVANGTINGDSAKFNFAGEENGSEDYAVGKIDHSFSQATTLSGSYQWDRGSLTQPDPYDQKLTGNPSSHNNFILSLQHIFSPNVLNTTKVGFSRTFAADSNDLTALNPLANDPSLAFIAGNPVGVITVGGLTGTAGGLGASGADIFHFTSIQGSNDLSWIRGRHSLKFGANIDVIRDNFNSANIPLGEWDYGSVKSLLTNSADDFTSDFPGTNGIRGLRSTVFGIYAEDGFRVTSRLTMNIGLRYETSTPVSEAHGKVATLVNLTDPAPRTGGNFFNNPTKRNFAPRIGLAWDPTGSGKTSVRAGFGIYDILPLPYLLLNRTHGAPFFLQGTVNTPAASAFPNNGLPLLTPNTARVAFVEANPGRAYNQQWNLAIQRQLTGNTALMIAYVGSHAIHVPTGIEDMDQVPLSMVTTSPDGHLVFPIPPGGSTKKIQRINPNFGRIVGTTWNDFSKYNGLLVDVNKRMNYGFAIHGAYTWSKSQDQGSATFSDNEFNNTAGSPYAFALGLQNGPSDYDITHNVVINTTWNVPIPASFTGLSRGLLGGWELGGIFQAHTGIPFTAKINSDQAFTGNSRVNSSAGGQRPDFNPIPGCSPNAINPGQPFNYINTQCFSFPAPGVLGNLGRNTLRGPGLEEFDSSLFKNISLRRETSLQFRAEVFNLLNHTNFGVTSPFVFNKGTVSTTAGILNPPTLTSSRQVQLGVKFIW